MKNLAGPSHAPLIADLKGKLLAEMKRIEDPAMAAVQAAK